MPQNGQYYDPEIENCHYRKIIDLSLVGETNLYNNLSNIPSSFNPSEHTNQHNLASSNQDGLLSKENKTKINKLTNFRYIRIIYNVEQEDVIKQYENVDWKIDVTNGLPLQFQEGTLIRMLASSPDRRMNIEALPPSHIYNSDKGNSDFGSDGEDGEDGLYWIPVLNNETGNLSWKLDKNIYPTDIHEKIIGPKGNDGKSGKPSKLCIPNIDSNGILTWKVYEVGNINENELPYIKDNNLNQEDWVLFDDFSFKFEFPKGDKGDIGEDGLVWIPNLDSNDNLTWSIYRVNNGINIETFNLNIKGKDVEANIIPNGRDGVNHLINNLQLKPYNEENENLRMKINHQFTNLNDKVNIEFKDIVLYQNYASRVVKTEEEAEKLFEIYKTGPSLNYVFVTDTNHYYKYNGKINNFNDYILIDNYENEELFLVTGVFLFNKVSRSLVYILEKGKLIVIPN